MPAWTLYEALAYAMTEDLAVVDEMAEVTTASDAELRALIVEIDGTHAKTGLFIRSLQEAQKFLNKVAYDGDATVIGRNVKKDQAYEKIPRHEWGGLVMADASAARSESSILAPGVAKRTRGGEAYYDDLRFDASEIITACRRATELYAPEQ